MVERLGTEGEGQNETADNGNESFEESGGVTRVDCLRNEKNIETIKAGSK